ncbi:BON domain-containing protein [Nakamurella sp. A5-74]|uniref:BON domain-containing protein n=1 Tax=Nakamurella sp. A5-74 TaxID=3158264 RepID=A0AAU8DUN3_9ACTN
MTQTERTLDQALQEAVTDQLCRTPAVEEAAVGVGVLSGTVTLSGEVRTYPEKRAALAAALGVRGVTAVADELVVVRSSDLPSDSRIAVAASEALRSAVSVPDTVQAMVHDHAITLSGSVSWDFERTAARHAVASLAGVVGVWSTMTITHRGLASPAAAEVAITAALDRTASLDAGTIRVGVAGNEVTLSGTVRSAVERRQAEDAAWSCPGASTVQNLLIIRS